MRLLKLCLMNITEHSTVRRSDYILLSTAAFTTMFYTMGWEIGVWFLFLGFIVNVLGEIFRGEETL